MSTWVIVASGPSLTPEDVAYCRGKAKVLVVNDNYRLAPWADVLYATDYDFWKWYLPEITATFSGKLLTVDEAAHVRLKIPFIRGEDKPGISKRRDIIHTNDNSGAAAMNVVRHLGAKRILLLGFDMQGDGEHWFGRHPKEFCSLHDFERFLANFPAIGADLAAEGIEVVNCTRSTALTCFRQSTIEQELQ